MTAADCWLNGELMPAAEARLPVMDHAVLYGDGVFEGIRFYRRRPFRLSQHLRRLEDSAAAIALTIPYARGELEAAVAALIAGFPEADGYLRLVVTRGVGGMGLDPASCARGSVFIIATSMDMITSRRRRQGIRAVITATRRLPRDGLDPRIKSLNYLNHILARIEAGNAGADEGILLNAQGQVTEATAANLFIVRGGELLTPPVADGALDGITRREIIDLAISDGLYCRQQSLAPYDLYTADECFLTGTGAELVAIAEIDGRAMAACPGPVFQRLQTLYTAACHHSGG